MFKTGSWGEQAKKRYELRKKSGYFKSYSKKYREENPESARGRVNLWYKSPKGKTYAKNARIKVRNSFDSLKEKCSKCGYSKCKWALHFHHLDRTKKDRGVSENLRFRSYSSSVEEINKCVLLCANCHYEEEFDLYQKRKTLP